MAATAGSSRTISRRNPKEPLRTRGVLCANRVHADAAGGLPCCGAQRLRPAICVVGPPSVVHDFRNHLAPRGVLDCHFRFSPGKRAAAVGAAGATTDEPHCSASSGHRRKLDGPRSATSSTIACAYTLSRCDRSAVLSRASWRCTATRPRSPQARQGQYSPSTSMYGMTGSKSKSKRPSLITNEFQSRQTPACGRRAARNACNNPSELMSTTAHRCEHCRRSPKCHRHQPSKAKQYVAPQIPRI